MLLVLAEMLNLDRRVVGHMREFVVEVIHDLQRVADAVEEIGIAKGNVLRASGNLLANVGHHHVAADDTKDAVVDRERSGSGGTDVCSRGSLR